MLSRVIEELCSSGATVILFGSVNRPRDFSRYLSDINVLALGGSRVNEVNGFISLIQTNADTLTNRCYYGDPLCIWLIRDSRIICGSPPEFKFNVTTWTIDAIRQLILNNMALLYENILLGNSTWALNNAYHAIKLAAIYKTIDEPTLDDLELADRINGKLSNLLLRLHKLRLNDLVINIEDADKVAEEVGTIIGVRLPSVGNVREKALGNPYASIQCDNYGCLVFKSDEEPWNYYYV
ncbi:hypothetical protein [Caldivirga sp. UBA161]|uniref:hypothetical protein n=1 Tax=Caldivirga sp. UBA161 TaxID=1915569 RepID=UPI0025C6F9E9|nr:hypothetical protein [Caldivirga sp. UBA161]